MILKTKLERLEEALLRAYDPRTREVLEREIKKEKEN